MPKYKALAITTCYWRPRTDYIEEVIKALNGKLNNGDFVVISEKAISTASNNIVDESKVKPSLTAKILAKFWMRIMWGYFLGPLCGFRRRLLKNIREYPLEEGSRHKQVALQNVGFLQSLMFGSEGGIDGSNLAYSYVSLPLENADKAAQKIREQIRLKLKKEVFVMISDTDKTFSISNFHFTHRKKTIKGIHFLGLIAYITGRIFKLKRRATPIVIAGPEIPVEEALEIAEAANRARGVGAGSTVWNIAERFKVGLTEVSWEMLETVKHKPIVVVKGKR
jgi:F420-0:gamma-glutamyl ligase-like protein